MNPKLYLPLFGVVLLLVAGIAWAVVREYQGVDKARYVRENEEILDAFPVYPGARFTTTWTTGIPADSWLRPPGVEGGRPYSYYITTRVYRLPQKASARRVRSFYRRMLEHRWRFTGPVGRGAGMCEAGFRRGRASVYISACNQSLVIDAHHGEDE